VEEQRTKVGKRSRKREETNVDGQKGILGWDAEEQICGNLEGFIHISDGTVPLVFCC